MTDTTDMRDPSRLFDQRLFWFLDANREGVLHLLRADQTNPPAAADLSLALQTLKTGAQTMCKVVENDGTVAEKERLLAETKKIEAETARLVAEKERLWAEKDRIKAETERIKAGKM